MVWRGSSRQVTLDLSIEPSDKAFVVAPMGTQVHEAEERTRWSPNHLSDRQMPSVACRESLIFERMRCRKPFELVAVRTPETSNQRPYIG